MDLYKARAGTLIKTNVDSPSFLTVEGMDDLLRGGKLLATSFRLDRGQDVQFLKTLNNLYYIYSFGEIPGKVMLGGLAFFADCNNASGQSDVISALNSYYEANNAYNRSSPIRIASGGASFNCLLTNFSIASDMNPYNHASFSLSFTIVPKK